MQTPSFFKLSLAVGLALLFLSCNNAKKDSDNKEKSADTAVVNGQVPADNKDNQAKETTRQQCFSNEGLKYNVVITVNFMSGDQVTGKISSVESGTEKKQVSKFTGTVSGDKLTIQFAGPAPVIGDASEWTNKPWTLNTRSGKENLRILFNAKNYDTNKWEETEYTFETVACQ